MFPRPCKTYVLVSLVTQYISCQCRRQRFDHLSRKIAQTAEQLSPGITTLSPPSTAYEPQLLKPMCPEPVLCNKSTHPSEQPLLLATRECPLTAMKTQGKKKITIVIKNILCYDVPINRLIASCLKTKCIP